MSCNRQWQHWYANTAPPPPGYADGDPGDADVNPSSGTASAEANSRPETAAADHSAEASAASVSIDDMADHLQQLEEQLNVEQTNVRLSGWLKVRMPRHVVLCRQLGWPLY